MGFKEYFNEVETNQPVIDITNKLESVAHKLSEVVNELVDLKNFATESKPKIAGTDISAGIDKLNSQIENVVFPMLQKIQIAVTGMSSISDQKGEFGPISSSI